MEMLSIGRAEAGQNLLRFLEARLGLPKAMIYRWLRSGQIRVNSGRSRADRLLLAGDRVRLPPLAARLVPAPIAEKAVCLLGQKTLGPDLPIIYQDEDLLVLNKPAGLAVQGGSGQRDSVTKRLRSACGVECFTPAPAHRLDKPASGLLLAGKTHARLRALHDLLQEPGTLEKEYLCWVRGNAAPTIAAAGTFLEDRILDKAAAARYYFLETRRPQGFGPVSLLRIRLLTGRKHQIRLQLSSRGYPLVGDHRYGGPVFARLLLHACSLRLPGGLCLDCPPDWPPPFQLLYNHV